LCKEEILGGSNWKTLALIYIFEVDETLLESDSDMSGETSTRQRLPSPTVPIWMEPDKEVEELEIPRSSDDLLLSRELVMEAVSIYEPLRRFSNLVRLTPFRFEDFCAALASEEQSPLLVEIHVQLLKVWKLFLFYLHLQIALFGFDCP
jgi:nucleosome-remodeling factor subunit BPTF